MRFGKGSRRNLRLREKDSTREGKKEMNRPNQAGCMCNADAKPAARLRHADHCIVSQRYCLARLPNGAPEIERQPARIWIGGAGDGRTERQDRSPGERSEL